MIKPAGMNSTRVFWLTVTGVIYLSIIPAIAVTQDSECYYNKSLPSLENARASFLTSKFECAEMEINDILNSPSLEGKFKAEAYILLAHIRYGMKSDSEIVIDCFDRAFQANPGWHGDIHFADAEFGNFLETGRRRAVKYFGESSKLIMMAGGGLTFPSSPGFNHRWKTGRHGLVGIGIRATRIFEVIAQLEVHGFGVEDYIRAHDSIYPSNGGQFDAYMFGIVGRVNLHMLNFRLGSVDSKSSPRLYLQLGIGGTRTSMSDIELIGAEKLSSMENTDFYMSLGACLEVFLFRKARLFIQARYVNIAAAEDISFLPVTFGIRF
jgi:hypothetical protein